MEAIEEYFSGDYLKEKNRIKEIESVVKDVLKTFTFYDNNIGWGYEISEGCKDKEKEPPFSCSTNAMILFTISKIFDKINCKSPILPNMKWEIGLEKEEKAKLKDKLFIVVKRLEEECRYFLEEENNKKEYITHSNSYGVNDPFTLSWMAELLGIILEQEDETKFEFLSTIEKEFNSIAKGIIQDAIDDYYNKNDVTNSENGRLTGKEKNEKKRSEKKYLSLDFVRAKIDKDQYSYEIIEGEAKGEASNHIFPLLRIIHLYKTLKTKEEDKKAQRDNINESTTEIKIDDLFNELQVRINQQISHSAIQNNLFDTAELVMSLEGLLLIDDKNRIDDRLISKVFNILKENQRNNLYWRPLKPFITSPQGHVLLPLSIEIANSMLRICKHLEVKNKHYFNDYFEIFEKYTNWLLSSRAVCKKENPEGKEIKLTGWHSENVQKQNVIHPWETAQVIIYLMNYKSMLQEHIAYKTLKKSGLYYNDKYKEEEAPFKFWDEDETKQKIKTNYVDNRGKDSNFSMLLYGPPGTGKSTYAEELARELKWRLITITPSDFIKLGESGIEERAKNIFKTLEEQQDCVILFDEIDRLILDRDSEFYSSQGDMFQSMTPSMLVKIKDLRVEEKSIFIIATNYEERIDTAIKRAGRIDEKYIINPPNKRARILYFKDKVEENELDKLVNRTVFFSYPELNKVIKEIKKGIPIDGLEIQPSINLQIYRKRLQYLINLDEEGNKKWEYSKTFPFEEYFSLIYLRYEVGKALNTSEIDLLNKVLNLCENDYSEYIKFLNDYDKNNFKIFIESK